MGSTLHRASARARPPSVGCLLNKYPCLLHATAWAAPPISCSNRCACRKSSRFWGQSCLPTRCYVQTGASPSRRPRDTSNSSIIRSISLRTCAYRAPTCRTSMPFVRVLRAWIIRLKGVATKYLTNYLEWFRVSDGSPCFSPDPTQLLTLAVRA